LNPDDLARQIAEVDKGYNPTEVYNTVTAQLGIPDARARVQGLQTQLLNSENAIKAVDPSVTGRTSGSLVTEAQRQRLVNMEREPLVGAYNDQSKSFGIQQDALKSLLGEADTKIGLAESGYKNKRQSLADQLDYALKQQQANESKRQFNVSAGQKAKAESVDPGAEFLDYIGNQFKGAGGAGNTKITRQAQDAWADAWFEQNGVSKNNRQGYWDLFNSTYNRSGDPTKDWRYAK